MSQASEPREKLSHLVNLYVVLPGRGFWLRQQEKCPPRARIEGGVLELLGEGSGCRTRQGWEEDGKTVQLERNVLTADFSAWMLWAEPSPSCLSRGLVHTSCLTFAVMSGGDTRKRGVGECGELTFLTHLCPGS